MLLKVYFFPVLLSAYPNKLVAAVMTLFNNAFNTIQYNRRLEKVRGIGI